MSSDAPHRIISTRERGTSTDINRITQLSDRNTALAAWYTAQNDASVSGVLTGLKVSVSGDTVTVNPGIGLLSDGVTAYPDSPYRWIEIMDGTTKTIDVGGTKVSGQWMVIDIEPGTTTTITTSVDVFDPTTGAFVSTSLDKEVQSGPVLSVRTVGTANEFPGGVADKMPLAYLYDDGGALADANLVHCRPLLRSKAPMDVSDIFSDDSDNHIGHQWVQGGGIKVTADGTTVVSEALTGRFYGHRQSFNLDEGLSFDLSANDAWNGGAAAKPATDINAYLYAIPAPYPAGYTSLSEREFVVGADVIAQFDTMNTGTVLKAQTGCIVVAATVVPSTADPGAQGAASANLTVFDAPFRDGGASVAVKGSLAVYMGSIDWATTEAKAQDFVVGRSKVVLASRWPGNSISSATGSPGAAISFNPRDPQSASGSSAVTGDSDGLIPAHVTEMVGMLRMTGTTNGTYNQELKDDETQATSPVAANHKSFQFTVASGAGLAQFPVTIVSTGTTITATEDAGDPVGVYEVVVASYFDPIIAAR